MHYIAITTEGLPQNLFCFGASVGTAIMIARNVGLQVFVSGPTCCDRHDCQGPVSFDVFYDGVTLAGDHKIEVRANCEYHGRVSPETLKHLLNPPLDR